MNIQKASLQNKQAFGNVVVLEPADNKSLSLLNSLCDQVFNSPFRTDTFQAKDGITKTLVSDGNEKIALDCTDEAFRKFYFSTHDNKTFLPLADLLFNLTKQFAEKAQTVKVSSLEDVLFIRGFQDLVKYMKR